MKRAVKILGVLLLTVLLLAGCISPSLVWDANETYNTGDMAWVREGDQSLPYFSLQDNNLGHYPPTSPEWWSR